jgi:integration host factor subunit beta
MINEVAAGNRLEFRDFGVFEVVMRKPRMGRNPRTGQKVAVPPKRVVSFKMGKVMKHRVATPPAAPAAKPATPPPPA